MNAIVELKSENSQWYLIRLMAGLTQEDHKSGTGLIYERQKLLFEYFLVQLVI